MQCLSHGKSGVQEEDSLNQQIRLKFKEETNRMLYLGFIFLWCWNLDTLKSRLDIPGKFWNMVVEKDGEDQLDRSCEKCGRVSNGWGRDEFPTENRKIGHILHTKCLLKHVIEGKIVGRIEVTGRRGRRREKLLNGLKGKERILETGRRSGRSHCLENSLWKRLWPCRKADSRIYELNEWVSGHYKPMRFRGMRITRLRLRRFCKITKVNVYLN